MSNKTVSKPVEQKPSVYSIITDVLHMLCVGLVFAGLIFIYSDQPSWIGWVVRGSQVVLSLAVGGMYLHQRRVNNAILAFMVFFTGLIITVTAIAFGM